MFLELPSVLLQNPIFLLLAVPASVLLAHLLPWLVDVKHIRDIPGPLLAKFSDAWLAFRAAQGKRSEHVHELHKKYGPVVRLAPDHVSIADSDALQVVYGHGTGTLKSNFYDAYVSCPFLSLHCTLDDLSIYQFCLLATRRLQHTLSTRTYQETQNCITRLLSEARSRV
jgi:hypothetical protein